MSHQTDLQNTEPKHTMDHMREKRVVTKRRFKGFGPVESIELILGFIIAAFGVYMAIVFDFHELEPNNGGSFSRAFATETGINIAGTIFFITGALPLVGIIFHRPMIRAIGSSLLFVMFLFLTFIRLLTIGFSPAIWLYPTALTLIAAVCQVWEWRRVDGR